MGGVTAFTSKRGPGAYLGVDVPTDQGPIMITLTAIVAALAVGSSVLKLWTIVSRRQKQALVTKTA